MANLVDAGAWNDNEVYKLDATDPVEGAAIGATDGGLGISNRQAQTLANRTMFLKQRQDNNIASIATLNAFKALFVGTLTQDGISIVKFPFLDSAKGLIQLIALFGYYNIGSTSIAAADSQIAVVFPIPFINALMGPPLLTNVYISTGGRNAVASVVKDSWSKTGFKIVFDVPGSASGTFVGPEKTSGVSYLAIGY